MRESRSARVFSFVMTTLNGYHQDSRGDLGWSLVDDEFLDWTNRQNAEVGALVLGRRTFEHFAEFWTTDDAHRQMPAVAQFMDAVEKIVVSRSRVHSSWANTTAVRGDALPAAIQRLRASGDGDIGVFGSSTLAAALLNDGLLDEVRVLVNPVLLNDGATLVAGLRTRIDLEPLATTVFRSGNVLLQYRPKRTD